ncbi:MAG: Trp family transcriptional regulator [Minisyncoccia bacterium]
MTRVNKKYFNKELKNAAWDRFSKVIKNPNSGEALALSMKKFLTPTEILMLEKRLLIPVLLEQGLSYRSIEEMIDVSPNTISFVKNGFMKNLVIQKKPISNKKKKELPLLPPRVGYNRWYYEKRKQ